MQRTIKFRAWDKTLNKIHSWSTIENHFTLEELLDDNFFEAMQYTGLKDKNGVEIYDGDYIRYSTRTINGSIFTHVCRVFQHESGTWRIEGYHEDNHSYETKGTVYAAHLICEVIGNIYEHNHLLG